MLDVKENTLHFDGAASATQRKHAHPSLLPLRNALIAAESGSPARPPRTQVDANEQRALQLIEKVKAEYKKPRPFFDWNDIPSHHGFRESLHEMEVTHA